MTARTLIAEHPDPPSRTDQLAEQVASYFFTAGWAPVDLMATHEDNRAVHITQICGGPRLGGREAAQVWKRATRLLAQKRREGST